MSEQINITPSVTPVMPVATYDAGGETLNYYNSGATELAAGSVVVVGNVAGVVLRVIEPGQWGALGIEGKFILPKSTNDAGLTAGMDAYWYAAQTQVASAALGPWIGKVDPAGYTASTDPTSLVQVEAIANKPNQTQVSLVTATGSTASNGAALSLGANVVSGADGTKCAVLPVPVIGQSVKVKNASTNTLGVFPDATSAINAIGSHGAITLASSVCCEFWCGSANQWYTIPLLPS